MLAKLTNWQKKSARPRGGRRSPRANDEKGPEYEEEVLEDLQNWSVLTAAEVHHVGTDNRPGDIVVRIPADGMLAMPLTIAIETRDRPTPVGRKVIGDSYGVRDSDSG